MSEDWIIAVLSDLQNYSMNNDLTSLAASLQDAEAVARVELAQESCCRPNVADHVQASTSARLSKEAPSAREPRDSESFRIIETWHGA